MNRPIVGLYIADAVSAERRAINTAARTVNVVLRVMVRLLVGASLA
jgi:hypothetical protein